MQIPCKRVTVERNGVKYGTDGILVGHIWDYFDLIMFKVIFGVILCICVFSGNLLNLLNL